MKFPDLFSNRIILKEIGLYGLKDMYEYSKIESFYQFLEFPPQKSINYTKEYLIRLLKRHKNDNAHYWFVELKETGKIIGSFAIHDIDWRKKIGEVSYGISPHYSKKGYFSEALDSVLKHCFNEMEFHRVCATTRVDNVGSIKGLLNAGFKREGILKDYYLCYQDKHHDAAILAIINRDYKG